MGTSAFADRIGPVLDAIVLTHVGAVNRDGADMLGIAARHLDDLRADFDCSPRPCCQPRWQSRQTVIATW